MEVVENTKFGSTPWVQNFTSETPILSIKVLVELEQDPAGPQSLRTLKFVLDGPWMGMEEGFIDLVQD